MTVNQPSIDVIVPVYKVEAFLAKCIDSLLQQEYDNYTIILVDDGSPDDCPRICDEYAQAYPHRVRVIHKENGGLSDARNAGANQSHADYIVFVDSDDHVSSRYLSSLYEAIDQTGADIAVSPVFREYVRPDGSTYLQKPDLFDPAVMDRFGALEELCFERRFSSYAVSKLIPREIALAHPFPQGRFFEDSFTTYRQFIACDNIAYVPEPTYCYLQRAGSIQRHRFEEKHMDLVFAAEEMLRIFTENNMPPSVMAAGAYKVCRACYITLFHAVELPWQEFSSVYKSIATVFRPHISSAVSCSRVSTKEKLLFRLMGMSHRLLYIVVKLFTEFQS